ncbi:hypothetical protein IWQ56_003333 [Coemansia nantahalensis]|nr:hypothetical protein IWQ56_003333 [Coemansia nantahalensis]
MALSKPVATKPATGPVSLKDGKIMVRLHVKPGARASGVTGVDDEHVHLRLAAPPREGEANKEAVRVVAALLGIPKSAVWLEHGQRSRSKTVAFHQDGHTAEGVISALQSAVSDD